MPAGSCPTKTKNARILFVTTFDSCNPVFSPSVALLSSILKQHGFPVFLHVSPTGETGPAFRRAIRNARPDIIAFSIFSSSWGRIRPLIPAAKRAAPAAAIIAGGYHPTFKPEDVLRSGPVDAVCIGEGEAAILEFAESIEQGRPDTGIRNLWFRNSAVPGAVIRNPLRPLIRDLDSLPPFDRDLFDRPDLKLLEDSVLGDDRGVYLKASRGCVFRCAFCANDGLLAFYDGASSFCRLRRPERVVAEAKLLTEMYPGKNLMFYDEVFPTKLDWLARFADGMEQIGSPPFKVLGHCSVVNEKNLSLLKRAGCVRVSMGFECGDETYRIRRLKKNITDEAVYRAFRLVHENGMEPMAFCMIGLPDETEEQLAKTLAMLKAVKPGRVGTRLFEPLPGSPLYTYCLERGFIPGDPEWVAADEFEFIRHTHLSREQLVDAMLEIESFNAVVSRKSREEAVSAPDLSLCPAGLSEPEEFAHARALLAKVAADLPASTVERSLPPGWHHRGLRADKQFVVLEIENREKILPIGFTARGTSANLFTYTDDYDISFLGDDKDVLQDADVRGALKAVLSQLARPEGRHPRPRAPDARRRGGT
ncbi:MAG: B12-binding domain-containing radical SAM protein [Deltaproteobacteria bacterium]|nr:B12-binding domain-containing radical SAM protein [Deltaproteobacteria bacterium]